MIEPYLYDQSILNYLRDVDNPDALALLTDMDDENDRDEELYAKRIYLAIRKLKQEYLGMADGESMDTYVNNLNYRQLVPFSDYLGYIQATNADSNTDYKDSIDLLANDDRAEEVFQTLTDNAVHLDKDDGAILKTIKLETGVDSSIPTIKELKNTISKIQQTITELLELKINAIESRIAEIEDANPPQTSGQTSHLVKDGESLSSIAAEYNTTIDEILQLNPYPNATIVNRHLIHAGGQIVVPTSPNANHADTVAKLIQESTSAIEADFDTTIAILQEELDTAKELLESISSGTVPNVDVDPDSIKALYRPYDETRRAHVKLAFSELLINEGDVNITK